MERLIKQMVPEGGHTNGGMVLCLNWNGLHSLLDGFRSIFSIPMGPGSTRGEGAQKA